MAVREALRFETDSSGSGSAMKISTEASDPLFSVLMSETSLVMTVDVGRTRVSGPWGDIQGDALELGNLDIDWQGLTYQIDLSADSDSVAVRNIGLGDGTSTIKLDSETLLSVDLNKDSGRSFDLELLARRGWPARPRHRPGHRPAGELQPRSPVRGRRGHRRARAALELRPVAGR